KQFIIAGREKDITAEYMLREVYKRFIPNKVLVRIDPQKAPESLTFASGVVINEPVTTAYVCENFACRLPVETIEEFTELL
ncbi:MAG: hypothetical protein JNK43_05185, partial [Ignavibacteria bacterium]|nr:hypothetical protein [Ignavibacteria bacterium]